MTWIIGVIIWLIISIIIYTLFSKNNVATPFLLCLCFGMLAFIAIRLFIAGIVGTWNMRSLFLEGLKTIFTLGGF